VLKERDLPVTGGLSALDGDVEFLEHLRQGQLVFPPFKT
jgi:hypothetical protein